MLVIEEAARAERTHFRDELVRQGLLVATGVAGLFGYNEEFEDTVGRVDRQVTALGQADHPEVMRFPPTISRACIERSGYLESFPHFAGAVRSFDGDARAHRSLLRRVEEEQDWSAGFAPTDVVLTPAACYPVYDALTGTLPDEGRLVDVMSYCFRHEPSDDPARLQTFRMHEHVRLGDETAIRTWHASWLTRAQGFASDLGLDARAVVASDPFFGRAGQLLAASQRDQRLKLEIVAPIASAGCPTAIISLNCHQDHFGKSFGIQTADGSPAHTACVGFGLERIALALYSRHGFRRSAWPRHICGVLGL
jgi:seryl-tRNA synthetase